MFLISNKFVQEEVWADWLLPVADLVHPDIGCYPDVKKCYTEHVLTTPARSVYDEQGLYNFYVHSKPDTPPFKEGSVFAGRTIETLVKVGEPCPLCLSIEPLPACLSLGTQQSMPAMQAGAEEEVAAEAWEHPWAFASHIAELQGAH